MADPRETMGSIMRDDYGACDASYMTRAVPSLQATWDGTWDLAREWMWAYLDIFLDPAEVATLRRQAKALRDFWGDLAALGEGPSLLNEEIIRELERRMVVAARPSGYRVACHSRNVAARVASANIQRLLTEESWRKRF